MNSPLVSVVMPVYNCRTYLRESVISVLEQRLGDLELLLVDDCSNDGSREIAEEFSKCDKRVRVDTLESNQGSAVSRNRAISLAKGRYIAFLDSDDIWFPHKLSVQLDFMQRFGHPFCYSAYEKISEEGHYLGLVGVPDRVRYEELLKTCVIGCLTAVYDTAYFGKVFMPSIRKRQDFGLWLKLLKRIDYAYGLVEPLAQYRIRSDSISSNKINAASYTWRLYRDVEELGLLKSCYYFSHYSVRGVLRQKFPALAKRIGVLQ